MCNFCLGFGACGGMYIVNIMVSCIEVFGMIFLYFFFIFVEDFFKMDECFMVGVVMKYLFEIDLKLCDIMIRAAFENVMVIVIVFGGFINAVFYLIVMVYFVGIKLILDDF